MSINSACPAGKCTSVSVAQLNPFHLTRAVRRSALSPSEKLLLLEVIDRAGNGSGTCTASAATLGRDTGLGERHVRTILARLAADCWIEITRASGSKFGRRSARVGPRLIEWMGSVEPPRGDPQPRPSRPVHPEPQFRAPGTADPSAPGTAEPGHPELQTLVTSFLTATKTSLSNEGAKTTDDVRFALSEKKTTVRKEEDHTQADLEGLERVCKIAHRCRHAPAVFTQAIRSTPGLGARINHDWDTLGLALVRLDEKIKAGDVSKKKKIYRPLNFLLTCFNEIRDGRAVPGEVDSAQRVIEKISQDAEPAPRPKADQPITYTVAPPHWNRPVQKAAPRPPLESSEEEREAHGRAAIEALAARAAGRPTSVTEQIRGALRLRNEQLTTVPAAP